MLKHTRAKVFFLSVSMMMLALNVFAADYPDHPIKFIIPFSLGGNADSVGYLIATELRHKLLKEALWKTSWCIRTFRNCL